MQRDGGPGGAGGAGNPVGGSFTGPAEALEVIGNHAYAYSGDVSVTGDPTTCLNFLTGNFYFKGKLQVFSTEAGNDDIALELTVNEATVAVQQFTNTQATYFAGYNETFIIIPSYTKFKTTLQVVGGSPPTICQIMLTGRIYRG